MKKNKEQLQNDVKFCAGSIESEYDNYYSSEEEIDDKEQEIEL